MPGAMAGRVPDGMSVSIRHLSKGMRPKADLGAPRSRPPSRKCGRTLPQASLPGLAAGLGHRFRGAKWREGTKLRPDLLWLQLDCYHLHARVQIFPLVKIMRSLGITVGQSQKNANSCQFPRIGRWHAAT